MLGITPEMIKWWFRWHPQTDERYKVWFYDKHLDIGYSIKQTEDGPFMINRFRLEKTINPLLGKIIINDDMAKAMTEHCCIEYRNLLEILPVLYNEEQTNKNL